MKWDIRSYRIFNLRFTFIIVIITVFIDLRIIFIQIIWSPQFLNILYLHLKSSCFLNVISSRKNIFKTSIRRKRAEVEEDAQHTFFFSEINRKWTNLNSWVQWDHSRITTKPMAIWIWSKCLHYDQTPLVHWTATYITEGGNLQFL